MNVRALADQRDTLSTAIARIDRLGQNSTTEVYCYYSEGMWYSGKSEVEPQCPADTVERNILDLGAKQGLSLYIKDHSTGTLLGMSENAQEGQAKKVDSQSKKQKGKGDFVHSSISSKSCYYPYTDVTLRFQRG
jgi:E3 ubiquitin-protein ligase SHPRH